MARRSSASKVVDITFSSEEDDAESDSLYWNMKTLFTPQTKSSMSHNSGKYTG